MGIFDTHAHYQDTAFDEDRKDLLSSLSSKNVDAVLCAATNLESSRQVQELAKNYPFIYAAIGLHPSDLFHIYKNDVEDKTVDDNDVLSTLKELYTNNKKTVAIGEIGLEYHYDFVPKELQKYWFEKQLCLANELDAPVIIHDRDAHEDTLQLLKKYKPSGVVHCFSGSIEMLKELLKLDLYIGLGGATTFKNARKPVEAAAYIPLEKLLLETDAPYMSPVPFRGQRCDSSMIQKTAEKIAEIKAIPVEELIEKTKENAYNAFPKILQA